MDLPHNGQFVRSGALFNSCSHSSSNIYDTASISIKKPPNTTLIPPTICLHCLWGPFIVCNLSLVQVSFFACKENIYCTLFK